MQLSIFLSFRFSILEKSTYSSLMHVEIMRFQMANW